MRCPEIKWWYSLVITYIDKNLEREFGLDIEDDEVDALLEIISSINRGQNTLKNCSYDIDNIIVELFKHYNTGEIYQVMTNGSLVRAKNRSWVYE